MKHVMLCAAASCGLLSAACQDLIDDAKGSGDAAKAGVDANDQAGSESRLILSGVAGLGLDAGVAPSSEEVAASAIAANLAERYTPSECVEVTSSGANVNATLTNCTGPWGLRQVSAELAIEVTEVRPNSVAFEVVGAGTTSGGASFDLTASAVYTGGAAPSLAITTTASGVGPRQLPFTREGAYDVTWTEACVAVEGSWETTAAGNTRTTTVDVEQCTPGCPTGTLVISRAAGDVTITFAGTATATWEASGLDGTIALSCVPAT